MKYFNENFLFEELQVVVFPEPTSKNWLSWLDGTRHWLSISNLFLKNIKSKKTLVPRRLLNFCFIFINLLPNRTQSSHAVSCFANKCKMQLIQVLLLLSKSWLIMKVWLVLVCFVCTIFEDVYLSLVNWSHFSAFLLSSKKLHNFCVIPKCCMDGYSICYIS